MNDSAQVERENQFENWNGEKKMFDDSYAHTHTYRQENKIRIPHLCQQDAKTYTHARSQRPILNDIQVDPKKNLIYANLNQ